MEENIKKISFDRLDPNSNTSKIIRKKKEEAGISNMSSELAKAEKRIKELEDEVKVLKKEKMDLFADKSNILSALFSDIPKTFVGILKGIDQLKSAETKYQAVVKENLQWKEHSSSYKNRMLNLTAKCEKAEKNCATAEKNYEAYKNKYNALRADYSDLKNKAAKIAKVVRK